LEDGIVDTGLIETILGDKIRLMERRAIQIQPAQFGQVKSCVACHHYPIRKEFHLFMRLTKDSEPAKLTITAKPSYWSNSLGDIALYKVAKMLGGKENIEDLELPKSVRKKLEEYF